MSVSVRISDDVYQKIKEISEKQGKSVKDVVEQALQAYVLGAEHQPSSGIKAIKESWILTKFKTKCSSCKKDLEEGELVYWVKVEYEDGSARSKTFCSDCYYQRIDVSLAKKYLKIKELKAVESGLRKELERLTKELERLTKELDLLKIREEILKVYNNFIQTLGKLTEPSGSTNEQFYSEIQKLLEEISNLVNKQIELENKMFLNKEVKKANQRVRKTNQPEHERIF